MGPCIWISTFNFVVMACILLKIFTEIVCKKKNISLQKYVLPYMCIGLVAPTLAFTSAGVAIVLSAYIHFILYSPCVSGLAITLSFFVFCKWTRIQKSIPKKGLGKNSYRWRTLRPKYCNEPNKAKRIHRDIVKLRVASRRLRILAPFPPYSTLPSLLQNADAFGFSVRFAFVSFGTSCHSKLQFVVCYCYCILLSTVV